MSCDGRRPVDVDGGELRRRAEAARREQIAALADQVSELQSMLRQPDAALQVEHELQLREIASRPLLRAQLVEAKLRRDAAQHAESIDAVGLG